MTPEKPSDDVILDALDWTPLCVCGHDMGDHASDGCPYEDDCDCTGYRAALGGTDHE